MIFAGVKIQGARVVVLGRSKIVGWPAANLFMWLHATVTMCHSRTENLKEECQRADILIVAVGKRHLVKGKCVCMHTSFDFIVFQTARLMGVLLIILEYKLGTSYA